MPDLQQITVDTEHYPIQIKSWKISVGDVVEKDQVLGIYEYLTDNDVSTRCEIRASYAGTIEELGEIDAVFTDEPGTKEFLEAVSDKFEMHIYTMGTRNYAYAIANAIDPDKKYFSDRILSRDDSGNNFFIGTGDINEPMKETPTAPIPTTDEPEESKSAEFKTPAPRSPKKQRPQIIEDDNDLAYISTILNQLHKEYYEQFVDSEPLPNVGVILPALRKSVLEGVHIVFSGVIPLAQDVRTHELWIQAQQFGATCHHELNATVTHVLAKKVLHINIDGDKQSEPS
ncbi:Carboxy-terminal domain (CTD) phosphatase [Boothiomyces macroporosus]|uniref:protein-serine/threonine phosphatase n=1 Tax=Boothiomyces macroporosus TaxID=261099 RepID=A0AAD5Y495_9FUNG|nr:Carboxy-terminal domain (CTD) phosphatase [Boothiomyces macroporosus]